MQHGYMNYLAHILLDKTTPLSKNQKVCYPSVMYSLILIFFFNLQELLKQNTSHLKRTPLHLAVLYGNVRFVEYLLKEGKLPSSHLC